MAILSGGDTMIRSVRACARRQRTHARSGTRAGSARSFGDALDDVADRGMAGTATVLHGRSMPGAGPIDHIVVASSGVWIIDVSSEPGRIRRRDVGGFMRDDAHLVVGDGDRTHRARKMGDETDGLERVIEPLAIAAVPLHRVLCFTDATWPRFARPFDVAGVLVCWPHKLVSMIADGGPFDRDTIDVVADHLARELPSTRR